ncbi:undecaprenyl-diphosphate phosphatase [Telmatospirillum sp. J64-1]|uniref:undecaprenyl-diphosphate phosphatase n=1 Tax=Telmatospirillum sp. J64-1 TaxID=2502183 RepID=UPI00163D95B7|nr:undecaprenyl-diphosphate phosphatase [Telmatospirillum sp. J64-1]
MTFLYLVMAAATLALGEVLPLDAAAHFLLWPVFIEGGRPPLSVLAASCIGLALGLLAFLWRDVGAIGTGLWRSARGKSGGSAVALAGKLALGSLLGGALAWGLLFVLPLRWSFAVTGWAALIGGLILFAADRMGMTVRRIEHITPLGAMVLGGAQALALLPGIGRTAITCALARLQGYERPDAYRLSLLLAIPALLAAGLWMGWHMPAISEGPGLLASAAVTAFFVGIIGASALSALMRETGFGLLVLYRLALGGLLLLFAYG